MKYERDFSMRDHINLNPTYDGNVDPVYYQNEALGIGGNGIARDLGKIIKKHLPIRQNCKPHVLDIAAGTGILTRHLADIGYETAATDLSMDALRYLQYQNPRIPAVVADMNETFPYPEASFDAVVTLWANRFITDIDHFAFEAHRLLKTDGYFFWPVVPLESSVWSKKLRREEKIKISNLVGAVQNVGFNTVTVNRLTVLRQIRHPLSVHPLKCIIAKK